MAITSAQLPHTVFLISPANLGGRRALLVSRPEARFALAEQLRSPEGAPLGELFSFVSGLYFRGKATYATTFGRPPVGLLQGAFVISPSEGLCALSERITLARLRAWSEVPIDEDNPHFTGPLERDAARLAREHTGATRFVLLGSVASDKYVRSLLGAFGSSLFFPTDFVGRGDMSRGALLLRAAREGRELAYQMLAGAARHGRRAPRINA